MARLIRNTPGATQPQAELTPDQQAAIAPLYEAYQRALTTLQTAQAAYFEAYGAYAVALRRAHGEIP